MRVRTDGKRCAILDTAASVFLEHGFERASMSAIAARMGGSKATLYGYFRSKEELFVAVVLAESEKHLELAFATLSDASKSLREALIATGEGLIRFIMTPDAIAAQRMVVSESGRSDIGRRFFANGRERGTDLLAAYLERASQAGRIRTCDFTIAATHLLALMEAEWLPTLLFGLARPAPTRGEIRASIERAVDVFLGGYGAGDRQPGGNK